MPFQNRLALQSRLETILGSDKVYYQPPATIELSYPCIVYGPKKSTTLHADNTPYQFFQRYDVTVIYKDPDSGLVKALGTNLEGSTHDRSWTKDNLYHANFIVW